jgi:hypothetical protein
LIRPKLSTEAAEARESDVQSMMVMLRISSRVSTCKEGGREGRREGGKEGRRMGGRTE